MTQLTILRYPDPRLHTVAKPVADVNQRLSQLVSDMFETMYEAAGIGLAATQVDVHERLIVIDVSEKRDEPMVLINPELVWRSEETRLGEEGCLSVPGIYDGVERSLAVKVQAKTVLWSPASGRPPRIVACASSLPVHLNSPAWLWRICMRPALTSPWCSHSPTAPPAAA